MSEMIERVAKVIVDAWQSDVGFDAQPDIGKHNARRHARAVLAAMRDPTREMLVAACEAAAAEQVRPIPIHRIDAGTIWQAMIDAALEEPK